ncbi:hypothetical protein P3T23_009630 [Paraburkholderia sp. GAS448]
MVNRTTVGRRYLYWVPTADEIASTQPAQGACRDMTRHIAASRICVWPARVRPPLLGQRHPPTLRRTNHERQTRHAGRRSYFAASQHPGPGNGPHLRRRTDFPDGNYLVDGPDSDRYFVSQSGSISANEPCIRRVQIEDLSQLLSHHVAYAALWRWRVFLSASAKRQWHVNPCQQDPVPDGLIVVRGTWRADAG